MDLDLKFPAVADFAVELPVRITDVNYGGHLGNDAVLALAHEARLQFLAQKGFSERDAGGAALIMASAGIEFRSQARWNETIRIEVALGERAGASFELLYRLTEKHSAREIARVATRLVFFDYERQRPVRMPIAFRNAFPPDGAQSP